MTNHVAGIVLDKQHITVDAFHDGAFNPVIIDVNTMREGACSHAVVIRVDGETVFSNVVVEDEAVEPNDLATASGQHEHYVASGEVNDATQMDLP